MKKGIIGFVLIVLVAVSFFAASTAMAQGTSNASNETKTLSVTGNYKLSMDPDKAEIYLGAETQATTALQSQQDNANIIAAVKNALYALGLTKTDIETTSYSLSPVYEYPKPCYESYCPLQLPKVVAYKTSHQLKIKTKNIDKVGQYIDAAAKAGANDINYISFGLSDDKQKTLYNQALTEAAKNAKEKANAIASGLNVHIVGVMSANEGYVSITPYYRTLAAGASTPDSTQAETDISAGMIQVSASVSVVYQI
jgi:hypothetical protein